MLRTRVLRSRSIQILGTMPTTKKSKVEKRAAKREKKEAKMKTLQANLENMRAKSDDQQANKDKQAKVKSRPRVCTVPQITKKEYQLLVLHPDSAVQLEAGTLRSAVAMYRQERKEAIARLYATDPELKAINEKFMALDTIAQRLKPLAMEMQGKVGVGNAPEESDTDDDSARSIKAEEDPDDDMARSDDEVRFEDGIAQLKQETREMDGLEQSTPPDVNPTQTPEVPTRGNRGNHSNGKRKRTRLTKSERQEFVVKRQRLESSMGNYVVTGTTRTDQPDSTIEGDQHERQPVVKLETQELNVMIVRTKQEEPMAPVKMQQDEDYCIKQEERDDPPGGMDNQNGCGYCVGPCQCYVPL
jgi:hypothetical protein